MELEQKYYLADGLNYFVYRTDKYTEETIRADLFNQKNEKIATTLVKGGMTNADKTEHDVINGFEVFILK